MGKTDAEIVASAETLMKRSEKHLVGYTVSFPTPARQNMAIIEMQRRLLVAISAFNKTSSRLTVLMLVLTVAIGAIAGLQLWAMLKGGV